MFRRMKVTVIILAVIGLSLSFSAGCTLAGRTFPPVFPSPAPVSTFPDADRSLETVQEAWDIILKNYVDQEKLDSSRLKEEAIKGLIEALDDPYTAYLNPQAYRLSASDLRGSFEGIGAHVGVRDKALIIIAPMPDSPAWRAGIRPGDTILEINGESAEGMSLEEAVARIRGPRGTAVKLLIQHLDEPQPVEVDIVRAEIRIISLSFEMKESIAYVRIFQFTERTDEDLSTALSTISRNGADGIILDVRSNPGGLLDEVVDVASHFLKEGIVVSTVDNKGNRESLPVRSGGVKTDLPVVVLTDNFSASASEVLSGALQDYGRATIAGTKTFGKGSVNQLFRLKDGSGLFITIARWFTPNGRLIEGKGITPDYDFDLKGDDAVQWALDFLKSKRQ
ncbi:MAG: S41 family peptidase [Chloroflexi bacterium]|nr:S41 family peptidase [Chloroflexota bacterium]